ncbi:MAG: hypothetical protein U9R74_12880 [Pseudomonadota bacterium]|nr:hypothetical protein [Pseudomonadota bacterium]
MPLRRTLSTVFVCASILITALPVASAPEFELQTEPFITALRASVRDNATGETLYTHMPAVGPQPAAMASTAKIMTLHVALQAVANGTVSLDDHVTISDKASRQACNCFPGTTDGHFLKGGDRMSLDDALYSVGASHGEPTVAVAEFIANAVKHGSKVPAANDEEAAALEQEFIEMMNLEVENLELTQTHFETVHGGDKDGQHTTPNDLIAIWNAAVAQDPRFLEYTGYAEHESTIYGTFHTFHKVIRKGGLGYHPGVDADKAGDSGKCADCLVTQATRAGRTLVAALMQALDGHRGQDADQLFTRGYETVFKPKERVESAPWEAIRDHKIACLSKTRAASAVVTLEGKLGVLLWDHDADGRYIEVLRPDPPPHGTIGGLIAEPKPLLPPPPPLGFTASVEPERGATLMTNALPNSNSPPIPSAELGSRESAEVTGVDTTYAGNGNLLVAVETDSGQRLFVYGIPESGQPFIRDWLPAGDGSDLQVVALESDLIVTGHRTAAGEVVLQSWSLETETGQLAGPIASYTGPVVTEFNLAGRGHVFLTAQIVIASRLASNNHFEVRALSINPSNGVFSLLGSSEGGAVHGIGVTRVLGFDALHDIYAVVIGAASDKKLKLITFHIALDGTLMRGGKGWIDDLALEPNGISAIVPTYAGGVVVAHKTNQAAITTTLSAWSIDGPPEATQPQWLANTEGADKGTLYGACRIPGHDAEADVLVAEAGFIDGALRTSLWRVGAR